MSEKMLLDIAQGGGASQVGTAGEKGTGLGLEICREFLALLGAKLHVKSKLGLGTTAEILLSSTE